MPSPASEEQSSQLGLGWEMGPGATMMLKDHRIVKTPDSCLDRGRKMLVITFFLGFCCGKRECAVSCSGAELS